MNSKREEELWDCIKDKNKEIEKLETILKEHQEHIQVLDERLHSYKYRFNIIKKILEKEIK